MKPGATAWRSTMKTSFPCTTSANRTTSRRHLLRRLPQTCAQIADPFMRATWPRPFSGGKIPFRHACGLGRKSPSGTSACRFPDVYALHGAGTQATSKRQPPCCATGFCTLPPLPVCPVPGKTVPGTGGKHSIQQRRTILRPELTAVSFHYALRGKKRKKCPPTISGGHFLRKVQATGHEH